MANDINSNVTAEPINLNNNVSTKSKTTAALLCFFFGILGVHRDYVGKVGTGILWLLTGGLFGVGAIIDFFIIIFGNFKDSDGKYVK